MEGLQDKLDETYLDGSPKRYGDFAKKYDDSYQYLKTPEGAIRGQGNLLQLFEKTKADGLLDPPPSSYITKIGSEVKTLNTPAPYSSNNTYSDQFRAQENEILLNRTIDEFI